MRKWLSIVFCCAIIFSGCATMLVDTITNDENITIEQVDRRLETIKEVFEDRMLILDTIQYDSQTFTINLKVPLSVSCGVECSLVRFENVIYYSSIMNYKQGLIWLQKPYFDYDTYTIETVFIIQQGMSQNI